jgi:hypothetical protein
MPPRSSLTQGVQPHLIQIVEKVFLPGWVNLAQSLVTCGTPWDRVVNVEGKRPVKIESGCPNEVCVLGDW